MSPDRDRGPILCLGEAIVDLVSEGELDSPVDAASFRPHFGGALANVAVAAARAGGSAALAGGVGDDRWGAWLRRRLEAEGVDLRWFGSVAGLQTPLAFVTFDRAREPVFEIYGDGIDAAVHSVAESLGVAVGGAGALIFGSNTLVGEPERELTLEARRLAIEARVPVLFDPNLRPNRWRDLDRANELCRQAVAGTFIVRANLDEARAITAAGDEASADDAARALCELGARTAVVTMGPDGAIARGEAEAEVTPAPAVEVVSPLGAGDAFLGALAAGAARGAWTPKAVAEALQEAVEAGTRACLSWGALE